MITYNYIADILNPYFLTFIIGITVYSIFDNALDWLNSNKGDIRGRIKDLHKIHPLMKKYFTFSKVSKAIEYNSECKEFYEFSSYTRHGFSTILLIFGVAPFLLHTTMLTFQNLGTSWCYVIFTTLLTLVNTVFGIPFSYYESFVLEEKYKFNTMNRKTFVLDTIKSFVFGSIITGILVYALNETLPLIGKLTLDSVPIIVGIMFLVEITMEFLSINVFMKMFNSFTPLKKKNANLERKLRSLVNRFGYGTDQVFVMDGSRRSNHSNAFICGFGKRHKKIVIYDTMLKNYTDDEILSVLGHELAHGRMNHILIGRISSILCTALVTTLAVLMVYDVNLYHAFGFNWITEDNVVQYQMIGLVLSSMMIGSVTWIKNPLLSAMSRRHEYAADRMSVEMLKTKRNAMVSALIKLNSENLSDVFPHVAYEWWHYGHPSLSNRILAITKKGLKHKNKKVVKKQAKPRTINKRIK